MSNKNNLDEKSKEWRNLREKNLASNDILDSFYEKEIFPLVIDKFIKNNRSYSRKYGIKVDYLILSVGTSYEPLVLSIKLFNPIGVLFLYTKETIHIVDKVVKVCNLSPAIFDKEEVEDKDSIKMYEAIKKFYKKWNYSKNICIDFTGGTKAMSATAAMAGAIINIPLAYIGNKVYLKELRKPEPGTEILEIVKSPYEVFGDLEIQKSMNLFSCYNYSGAKEKLEELSHNINIGYIKEELELLCLLASTYEKWDGLEFEEALKAISELIVKIEEKLSINNSCVMSDFLPKLKKQKKILISLSQIPYKSSKEILENKECVTFLMFSMYTNAQIRENQKKYDLSALILYRLLETIEQRRLIVHGIYVSNPDYSKIDLSNSINQDDKDVYEHNKIEYYKKKVNEVNSKVFKSDVNRELTDKIALLEGFIQLCVLKDEIFSDSRGAIFSTEKVINQLQRIRSNVEARNNSILAHGLTSISDKNFNNFKKNVVEYFKKFCIIEQINFETYKKDFIWINPINSRYYNWR